LVNLGSAGEQLDGLIVNAPWTVGRWTDKGALAFRGPNSQTYVDLGDKSARELNFSGPFSVAVWFRVGGSGRDWPALVTKGDSAWRLHLHVPTGSLAFGANPAEPLDAIGRTRVTDGRWHLGVAVYEPAGGIGVKNIFVDGQLDATQEIAQPVAATAAPVFIGENADRLGREFFGQIDEVAIFRRALSAAEVAAMFAAGNPYAPPDDASLPEKSSPRELTPDPRHGPR
jgi:hypothetical protein